MTNALEGEPLPVYGDGKQVREWLHAEDHCAGIELVLREGAPGEVYNVGGEDHENLEVTYRILELTGADQSLIRHVDDRAGHDRRYAVDDSKLRALGWAPAHSFGEGACRRPSIGIATTVTGGSRSSRVTYRRVLRPSIRQPAQGLSRLTENTFVVSAMRYLSVLVISLVLAAAAAAADPRLAPVAPAPMSAPVYVLTGGGYGHGVGLGQYGALAQAKAGRTYRQILDFYYEGTAAGTSPVSKVRVLLATGKPSAVIDSPVPFVVRDATGVKTELPAGPVPLGAGPPGPRRREARDAHRPPGVRAGERRDAEPERQGVSRQAARLGRRRALQVIDLVGLDAYLLGVVPGEVPKDWPAEALKAQAVAARSYALANIVKKRPFDLYADQRSQVYAGVAAETPATTAAVLATRREIRTFDGKAAIHVVLLVVGWSHGLEPGCLRCPVRLPPDTRRSVGRALPVPSLGAEDVHARDARSAHSGSRPRWSTSRSCRRSRGGRRR